MILTPTRELALQISECIDDYAKYTQVRHGVIFGGVNQRAQVNMLHKGVDILVATPGRLLDLMNQGYIRLDSVRHFVLDEADRMLDMGFIHDIKRLLPKLPKEKQTLFFSATMPDTIIALTNSLLKQPVKIAITPKSSTVDTIEQTVYFVEKKEKSKLLISILHKAGRTVGTCFLTYQAQCGQNRPRIKQSGYRQPGHSWKQKPECKAIRIGKLQNG